MALLELDDVHTYYGNIHALKGISLTVEQGEIVTLIGANGAGKTHDAADDLRPAAAARGRGPPATASASTRLPPHKIVELGICQVARGAAHLPAHDRAREPGDGRLHAQGRAPRSRPTWSASSTLFPRLQERLQPEGRHAVGRRAADAGDRPGADGPPEGAAAGRAVDGPGADPGRDDLRHRSARSTQQGTTILLVEQNALMALAGRRPRLRAADRPDRARGPAPALRRTRWSGRPTSARSRRVARPRGAGIAEKKGAAFQQPLSSSGLGPVGPSDRALVVRLTDR